MNSATSSDLKDGQDPEVEKTTRFKARAYDPQNKGNSFIQGPKNDLIDRPRLRTRNIMIDGIKTALSAAMDTINFYASELKDGSGHPTSNLIESVIGGLNVEASTLVGVVNNVVSPISGGMSDKFVDALLGSTFDTLTDASTLLMTNLVTNPWDTVLVPVVKEFSQNLEQVSTIASKNSLDRSGKLAQISQQLKSFVLDLQGSIHLLTRRSNAANTAANSISTAQKSMSILVEQLTSAGKDAGHEHVLGYINSLNQQVSRAVSTIPKVMNEIDCRNEAVNMAILGPCFNLPFKLPKLYLTTFKWTLVCKPLFKNCQVRILRFQALQKIMTVEGMLRL